MLLFPLHHVYSRRAEIVGSVNACFRDGEWLDMIFYDFDEGRQKPKPETLEWCEAHLTSPYTFSTMSLNAVTTENWFGFFTSEDDLIAFTAFCEFRIMAREYAMRIIRDQ